jgi:hypothetical protein
MAPQLHGGKRTRQGGWTPSTTDYQRSFRAGASPFNARNQAESMVSVVVVIRVFRACCDRAACLA